MPAAAYQILPSSAWPHSGTDRIDLKSFYASVECVERGLDPLTARLLVADDSRSDATICLAVSPALKALGVPGRPRLFEAKQKIREAEIRTGRKIDYITAVPQMAKYPDGKIHQLYCPDLWDLSEIYSAGRYPCVFRG